MYNIGDNITVPAHWFFSGVEGTVEAEVRDVSPASNRYLLQFCGRNHVVNGEDLPQSEEASVLDRLAHSITSFYERFGLVPSTDDTINVFKEEANEFVVACSNLLYYRVTSPEKLHTQMYAAEQVALEFADLLYTAVGHALRCGVQPEQLFAAIEKIIAKNDAKTHQTHEVVILPNGAKKIQRVGRTDTYDAREWDE